MHFDSLTSLISGMGDPTRDKLASVGYTGLALSDLQLHHAYTTSWMIRKAVDIPAQDATRKWRVWQGEPDAVAKMQSAEKAHRLKAKVREAKRLARLWGGAAIVIGDGSDDPSQPIDPIRLQRGGLKYTTVLPRRELGAHELDRDPATPTFGWPTAYDFVSNTEMVTFHPSRLAIFTGAEQADRWSATGANMGWGDSVLTAIYEAMKQGDSVLSNVASLVFEANIDVIRAPNLMSMSASPEYQKQFIERATLAAASKSINKTLLMDLAEEYDRKPASFGNLDKIIDQFLRVCAGAADIPMTRFMAQSPAGLSATGDGDMRNYYDMVSAIQEDEISPALETLDACLVASTVGPTDELTTIWQPLEQMNEKEQAEIGVKHAETASKLIMAGTHEADEMRKIVTPVLTDLGVFPGMAAVVAETDEAISEEFDLGGSEPGNDGDD